MQHTTKSLQLPFEFDTEKLLHDLSLILESKWIPHFNTNGYNGAWKVIPLYAKNGDASNIFAHSNDEAVMLETPLMKDCAYFKKVIDSFQCPILTARILKLDVGAEIKPHRDHELGYENDNFRIHIPITTNEDVSFVLDGERLKMLPGECWYTNVNYVHSVANRGKTNRVHLVIDGERNQWSDDLFFSLAPKESFFPIAEEEMPLETMKQMMIALEERSEPAAKQMMAELEEKIMKAEQENEG